MSTDPGPQARPSRSSMAGSGASGAATVSMCPMSAMRDPAAAPRTSATRVGPPGPSDRSVTSALSSRSATASRSATRATPSASPVPLRIATSSASPRTKRSAASFVPAHVRMSASVSGGGVSVTAEV